uniref:DUF4774 domain-containing protein n=1 Tax=Panagrellus redivivus TaxID=6233 RepID=A0A7E4ZSV9_PANRE
MSNYVNYGNNFQGRRAAVQSVYYPAARNSQFQASAGQAGFETDQFDAGIPQQQYGNFASATSAAPSGGAGVIQASGAYQRPAQQNFNQAPAPFAARGPVAPFAVAAPAAVFEAPPAPYIESTYLAAGLPNQQFQYAQDQARVAQNQAFKAQAEAVDQLAAFDAAGAAASESAIQAAQLAYNDAINRVNEARARLSELGAVRGQAQPGLSFEYSNPSGAGVQIASVDAAGKPQVFGVRFAEQTEIIERPADAVSSEYRFKGASLAPAKARSLDTQESVYFGMPNNLHYAKSQPQAYNVYAKAPASSYNQAAAVQNYNQQAAAAKDSEVATAVLDSKEPAVGFNENAGFAAPSEAPQADNQAAQDAGRAASGRDEAYAAYGGGADSDYHLDSLRY